jgi:hypothetical protein
MLPQCCPNAAPMLPQCSNRKVATPILEARFKFDRPSVPISSDWWVNLLAGPLTYLGELSHWRCPSVIPLPECFLQARRTGNSTCTDPRGLYGPATGLLAAAAFYFTYSTRLLGKAWQLTLAGGFIFFASPPCYYTSSWPYSSYTTLYLPTHALQSSFSYGLQLLRGLYAVEKDSVILPVRSAAIHSPSPRRPRHPFSR